MSDVPLRPGWWQAGDGRWYPPPPGLSDESHSRPPTPAPDHPPYAPRGEAARSSTPLPPTPERRPNRVRSSILAVVAVLVVAALVTSVVLVASDQSSTTASATDPDYQLVIDDLIDSELTNLIFLETFWDGYGAFRDEWEAASPAERPTVAQRWFSDIESQVAQFRADLEQIETDYTARDFANGSIPDEIRDLAIDHYRTWRNWAARIISIANDWYNDRTSTLSLYGYATEVQPELDARIESTFTALCATLEDTQPADGSFVSTITDICANS